MKANNPVEPEYLIYFTFDSDSQTSFYWDPSLQLQGAASVDSSFGNVIVPMFSLGLVTLLFFIL